MQLTSLLERVQKDLPVFEMPGLAPTVHWTPVENLPVHRWFRYREGFSPALLSYFSDSESRLDPFCGCGTTLLESARQGVSSYGVDLNPLATFLAQTKTKQYSEIDRSKFRNLSEEALHVYQALEPTAKPSYELLDKIFLPESRDTLLRLKAFIEAARSETVYNLLFLAWLSILERSSNVFKEGNGLKYRNKRRKPGKYATLSDEEWIPRYFGSSIRGFIENLWHQKCNQIVEDILNPQFATVSTPLVRTGSCLDPENLDFGRAIDLAIFSPPYANRFDYFEAFKVELWMGGFVNSQEDMALLRSKSVRNNLAAKTSQSDTTWSWLSPFLAEMDSSASSVRMGIKATLQGYFDDMRTLLKNLKQVLIEQGKVVIVVGNSAYAKSIIPTDLLVARLGQEEGYRVRSIQIARHLHVSSQQRSCLSELTNYMRESVIVLEKQ